MRMLEFPVFCEFTEEERDYLYGVSRVLSFPPGGVIYREGDPGDGLYCVLAGTVTVSKKISEQKDQILATFTSGCYFGEMAVIDDHPRSTTARSEALTEILFIPKNAFEGAMSNPEIKPKLLTAFLEETFRRLRETNRIASEVILRSCEAQTELERMGQVFQARAISRTRSRTESEESKPTPKPDPERSDRDHEPFEVNLAYHTQRLSEIVEEIIQLTYMNGWSFKLGKARFCISELLKTTLDRREGRLGGKGLDLDLRLNGARTHVSGDHYLLDRALTNLLGEAISTAKPGGRLIVQTGERNENGREQVEICFISETEPGIDITAERKDSLRINGSNGLPAVRQIAWLHEGALSSRRVNDPFFAMKYTLTLPLCEQES